MELRSEVVNFDSFFFFLGFNVKLNFDSWQKRKKEKLWFYDTVVYMWVKDKHFKMVCHFSLVNQLCRLLKNIGYINMCFDFINGFFD